MALVEIYHVVAANRAVATGESIKEGQIVSLNTSGQVVLQGASYKIPYGLAGDTKSTSASSMPGVASGWQNRVSDYFDETKASGKMTVYHSGGEFATDQFASNVASASIMDALYARSGVLDTIDQDGNDNTTAGVVTVARLVKAAGAYPSGVPGVDINGDIALGGENSNTYIEIKLLI
jgi:hypothetical protein